MPSQPSPWRTVGRWERDSRESLARSRERRRLARERERASLVPRRGERLAVFAAALGLIALGYLLLLLAGVLAGPTT